MPPPSREEVEVRKMDRLLALSDAKITIVTPLPGAARLKALQAKGGDGGAAGAAAGAGAGGVGGSEAAGTAAAGATDASAAE